MVDIIKGVVEDVVGKAKEVVGTVAGRNDWISEGQAQQDKAEALRNATKKEAQADKARADAKIHEARERAEQMLAALQQAQRGAQLLLSGLADTVAKAAGEDLHELPFGCEFKHVGAVKFVGVGKVVAEKIRRIVAAAHHAQLARSFQFIAHRAQDHIVILWFLRQQDRSGSGQKAGDCKNSGDHYF